MEDVSLIYEKEHLSKILVGHQAIENKMDFLLGQYFENPTYYKNAKLTFAQKTNILMATGIVDDKFGSFIMRLNKLRNTYSHNFAFDLDFEEAFILVKLANEAKIYFSDDTIWNNKEQSKEIYNVEWIVLEVFSNTNMKLCWIMEDKGIEVYY